MNPQNNEHPSRHRLAASAWRGATKQSTYRLSFTWRDEHQNVAADHGTGTYLVRRPGEPPVAAVGGTWPHSLGDLSPEEFVLAGISSAHMLAYLRLCATHGVNVVAYRDEATLLWVEVLEFDPFSVRVILRPNVLVSTPAMLLRAAALHDDARRRGVVARSLGFPVRCVPSIDTPPASAPVGTVPPWPPS